MLWEGRLSPEIKRLLDAEKLQPPLPVVVKTRALTRARAALAAQENVVAAAASAMRATASSVSWSRPFPRRRGLRFAFALGLVGMSLGAIGAVAAMRWRSEELRARARLAPTPVGRAFLRPAAKPAPVATAPVADVAVVEDASPSPEAPRPAGTSSSRASRLRVSHAELALLGKARTAVASRDFAAALPWLAAHARRFKDGRLAEERDALKVKALVGLGRSSEARRAARTFNARYPHSPLLPAVEQMAQTAPSETPERL